MDRTSLPPCLLWLLVLAASMPATGQTRDPGPPLGLEVEPNAIQDIATPMKIRVAGIPRGEPAHLQVLQDCDGDNRPDLQGTATCKNPLQEWDSSPADAEGVEDRLDFQALRAAGKEIPADQRLWLRASRKGSSHALYALFGLVKDPCSLWQSFLATFQRGPCRLGLVQALLQHRGAPAWKSGRYEVRRLDLASEPFRPVSVPGTQGATGVAWLDERTLLVTVAPVTGPSRLLRVSLADGKTDVLWEAPGDDPRLAIAPLALPGGRIAFVRQAQGASSALLSLWENGSFDTSRDLELPGGMHQLAASDPTGQEILALTLGVEESQRAFLRIDLAARRVENLGFHPALYQAVFSSPKGDRAIVAFEDNSGQTGWDLALVDAAGKFVKDVQVRPEDDLLPAWQPDGGGLAFLAEVESKEKKP
ncbi:MAG TPA: hypothetical protein VEW48_25290 [Thermoanaerobaculia bacterium]|nr:hypothetical protein [Thermoanaerobaculia bacterium]